MSKNFFEIKNVDFVVGGKTKVKNVSLSIENEAFFSFILPPIVKSTFLISKKSFLIFPLKYI